MSLPKITSAMLIVTHSCPLACRYCFVHQEACHMSYETAKAAVDFLIKNAEEEGRKPGINFFGGEPMVMWDKIIVPLTRYIRKDYGKPFDISMTTNGILLTDDRIAFLKKNKVSMLLSIDGAKTTQDYNRPFHGGIGSFNVLEPLLPKIVENFPYTTFRMTTIPPTCQHVFENIMFAADSGFKAFFVMPNVFEEWSDTSREILAEEIRKYGDYYIECYRNSKIPIKFSTLEDSFKNIKMINNAILNDHYRTVFNCKACGKCGLASNAYASIHPNGNVYGCQEMTSNEGDESIFYIGNIFTGIDDERRHALMALFDDNTVVGKNCDTCKYNRICDGGCVANNYLTSGSLHVMPEVFCWWKQIILEEAIRIMNTLGSEENEMFRDQWGRKR